MRVGHAYTYLVLGSRSIFAMITSLTLVVSSTICFCTRSAQAEITQTPSEHTCCEASASDVDTTSPVPGEHKGGSEHDGCACHASMTAELGNGALKVTLSRSSVVQHLLSLSAYQLDWSPVMSGPVHDRPADVFLPGSNTLLRLHCALTV